jgi:hypothetical protein
LYLHLTILNFRRTRQTLWTRLYRANCTRVAVATYFSRRLRSKHNAVKSAPSA